MTFDPEYFTFKLDTTVCFLALLYANISTYLTSKSCGGFSLQIMPVSWNCLLLSMNCFLACCVRISHQGFCELCSQHLQKIKFDTEHGLVKIRGTIYTYNRGQHLSPAYEFM